MDVDRLPPALGESIERLERRDVGREVVAHLGVLRPLHPEASFEHRAEAPLKTSAESRERPAPPALAVTLSTLRRRQYAQATHVLHACAVRPLASGTNPLVHIRDGNAVLYVQQAHRVVLTKRRERAEHRETGPGGAIRGPSCTWGVTPTENRGARTPSRHVVVARPPRVSTVAIARARGGPRSP